MQCTTNQIQTWSDRETHIHNEHGTHTPEITGIMRNPPDAETLSLMCVSLNKDLTWWTVRYSPTSHNKYFKCDLCKVVHFLICDYCCHEQQNQRMAQQVWSWCDTEVMWPGLMFPQLYVQLHVLLFMNRVKRQPHTGLRDCAKMTMLCLSIKHNSLVTVRKHKKLKSHYIYKSPTRCPVSTQCENTSIMKFRTLLPCQGGKKS